jgi:hypothetical protein
MATFTNKKLCRPTRITATVQTVYTVPANASTIVSSILFANNSVAPVDVSLYFCVGNEDATDENIFFPGCPIPSKDLVNLCIGHVLNAGDTIKVLGSVPGVTLHVSGIEIT